MRVLVGALLACTACSQVLGIGGEFSAGDARPIDGTPGDAHVIAQGSYIKASNPGANDEFGGVIAVSHDGNTMVVGASLEDSGTNGINSTPDNLALDAGAAYVFVRAGSMWTQQAYIKASNSDASDRFGFCAAISADGNTLAIGAVLEDSGAVGINGNQVDNLATNAGAVYVFTRTGTTWTQRPSGRARSASSTGSQRSEAAAR